MNHTCPSCGREASGRFCSDCGADLEQRPACASCGHTLPPSARFCNQCGAAAAGTPARSAGRAGSRGHLPWALAGAVIAAVAVFLVLPRDRAPEGPPQAASAALPGDPAAVDISSMTPRERADRLFNRVMQSVSSGDSAQARAFLPMALAAYDQVPELDSDGIYHAAVLHLVAGQPEAARRRAAAILESDPNHLFGLFTAAQAEVALGDPEAARALYRRFLDSYEAEISRDLPEYRDHAQVLPVNRAEAEAALAR